MSRARVASVVAVLAVATLASVPAQAEVSFREPVRTGGTGYEPGLDITASGTILVNEPGSGHPLYRSTDGGLKFKRASFTGNAARLPGGFDSDAVAGHDGRVYYMDLSLASDSLMWSDDDGATFTDGTPFTTLPVSDRQWLAVGPKSASGNETVYGTYEFINPPFWAMFARSDDSGKTWAKHVAVGQILGASGYTGQLIANDDGFVAFPFFAGGQLYLGRSTDRGDTWSRAQVTKYFPPFTEMPSIALDGNTIHAVWVTPSDFSVQYARSDDLGRTWQSFPVQIAAEGSNVFPWVAARDGKVSITWYGSTATTATNMNRVSASTLWFLRYSESLDGGLTFTEPVDAARDPVKVGPVCTNGLGCTADRELGDFMQVQLDAAGHASIAYASHAGARNGLYFVRQN